MVQYIICICERCKQNKECRYYGSMPDIDKDKIQNGEWLCNSCAEKRIPELDEAISKFRKILDEGNNL